VVSETILDYCFASGVPRLLKTCYRYVHSVSILETYFKDFLNREPSDRIGHTVSV
jgi:hypothetical protein